MPVQTSQFHYSLMVMVFTALLNLYGITKFISHVHFLGLLSLILLNQGNDNFNINFSMKGTKVQTLGARAVVLFNIIIIATGAIINTHALIDGLGL